MGTKYRVGISVQLGGQAFGNSMEYWRLVNDTITATLGDENWASSGTGFGCRDVDYIYDTETEGRAAYNLLLSALADNFVIEALWLEKETQITDEDTEGNVLLSYDKEETVH